MTIRGVLFNGRDTEVRGRQHSPAVLPAPGPH